VTRTVRSGQHRFFPGVCVRFHLAVWLLVLSCGDGEEKATGETGLQETDTDTDSDTDSDTDTDTDTDSDADTGCPDGIYEGPTVIASAIVYCVGTTARYGLETEGLTSGGYIYSQETAGQYAGGQWADNHTLEPFDTDPCGYYDRLDREVQDGTTLADPLNDWQSDVSTIFTCSNHLQDNTYMTFAFAVDDLAGNLASCLAFGHDVQGMIDGLYYVYPLAQPPAFDLSVCVEGVEAN
jgi:hypothetical protein